MQSSILALIIISTLVGHQLETALGQLTGYNDDLSSNTNVTAFESHLPSDVSEYMHENSKCQPLRVNFCENVGYNQTILPNIFNHQTQADFTADINLFHPLLQINCSPDIQLFLCTAFAPICFEDVHDNKPAQLLPCRSLCESARTGCLESISKHGGKWPDKLNCSQFPEKNETYLCVGKNNESNHRYNNSEKNIYTSIFPRPSFGPIRDLGFVCPKNFQVPSYKLQLNGKIYNNCAMPCEDVLLDKSNSQIVRLTTGILAIICFISTIFTCVTFLVDTKRFKYPSRPIIIIAFCQLIVATCYLIGFITDNKIACNDPAEPPKSLPNMEMIRTMTSGNKKGVCTLQFMALYFFQISTVFWWLMLTISWFMIARLKWAPEAVSSVAKYFHLFSWTTSALLTIYLSVLGNIEGDSLTGTCYVNTSDQESIMTFIVYPMLISLLSGIVFLLSGFKSLWDNRESLKREYGQQTDEHHKLIMRIGIYSTLFIFFTFILISCHYYEQMNLNSWMFSWLSNICKNQNYSIPCPKVNFSNQAPTYGTFVLKYVATMAIGIISALFMLSEKTFASYKEVSELYHYEFK